MNERNLGGRHVELDGAIDLHVHFGPEPLIAGAAGVGHAVTAAEAAAEALRAGMAAIVLKAHEFPSTALVAQLSESAGHVRAFAGICCDFPVGGINPVAVETALRAGARVVWLPTISSATYEAFFPALGWAGRHGLRIVDNAGRLLPEVEEILSLVRQHDAVLATGHVSRQEHFAVARAFASHGTLVVTHAMQQRADGPNLSADDCVALADLGAIIEFTAHTCIEPPAVIADILAAMRRLPPHRVVLSTDYGWSTDLPNPVPGLGRYLDRLYELGLPVSRLREMACRTPARVLRIDS